MKFIKIITACLILILTVCSVAGCDKEQPLELSLMSVYQLAKRYGFEEVESYHDLEDDNELSGVNSFYYPTSDKRRASDLYDKLFNSQGLYPDRDATEFIVIVEKRKDEDIHIDNTAYLMSFESEDIAKELFASVADSFDPENKDAGEKDGYSYAICRSSAQEYSGHENECAVYLKGNSIFFFSSTYPENMRKSFVDNFCSGLGLISPETLRK